MNKLILDGVEYGLSDSLVAKLKEEIEINDAVRPKPSAFDRLDGKKYYFIDGCGRVNPRLDVGDGIDYEFYSVANYCRDEEVMKQRALHETLNRLLWRYSEMHGGDSKPWPQEEHWFICCNTEHEYKMVAAINNCHKIQGVVYFSSSDVAVAAIEEVVKPFLAEHPEFVW